MDKIMRIFERAKARIAIVEVIGNMRWTRWKTRWYMEPVTTVFTNQHLRCIIGFVTLWAL